MYSFIIKFKVKFISGLANPKTHFLLYKTFAVRFFLGCTKTLTTKTRSAALASAAAKVQKRAIKSK